MISRSKNPLFTNIVFSFSRSTNLACQCICVIIRVELVVVKTMGTVKLKLNTLRNTAGQGN